jgi:hypothetical protein
MSLVDSKDWQGGIASVAQTRPSVVTVTTTAPATVITRRNMGGRRPTKNSGVCVTHMTLLTECRTFVIFLCITINVQLHDELLCIPLYVGSACPHCMSSSC